MNKNQYFFIIVLFISSIIFSQNPISPPGVILPILLLMYGKTGIFIFTGLWMKVRIIIVPHVIM